jgi:hypothetical protein
MRTFYTRVMRVHMPRRWQQRACGSTATGSALVKGRLR